MFLLKKGTLVEVKNDEYAKRLLETKPNIFQPVPEELPAEEFEPTKDDAPAPVAPVEEPKKGKKGK